METMGTDMSKKMIKFVCISDTHTKTSALSLPKGDVLIHAGDFSFSGQNWEIEGFNKFLKKFDFKHKIVIAGNHELTFDNNLYMKNIKVWNNNKQGLLTPDEAKSMLDDVIYLENSSVDLYGYKIWGSPVTPEFFDMAFMKNRGEEINEVWKQIPSDTDILITHGPPYNILDKTKDNLSVGCEELAKHVLERVKPKYHIFGHIHEANGMVKIDDTVFINASICNLKYKPMNSYYTFELEDKSDKSD